MSKENVIIIGTDTLITAVFYQPKCAEIFYHILWSKNYKNEDINLIMSDKVRDIYFSSTLEDPKGYLEVKYLGRLGRGAPAADRVEGLSTALADRGTYLLLSGLSVVISGPLEASLAITGGLVKTLGEFGLPDNKARLLENEIKLGSVVIGIKTKTVQEHDWLMRVLTSSFDSVEFFNI